MIQNREVLQSIFDESNRILGGIDDDVWRQNPVGLNEFIIDHLGLGADGQLTDRQYQDITSFLGTDPKNIFPRNVNDRGSPFDLLCWLVGKGGGKDYAASIVVSYVFYLLMCMKSPQKYFGWPAGEAIDIVIVSYSADQARTISFDKIKERFRGWSWLRNNYSIIWGEKLISGKGKPEINVYKDRIIAHNNVRIFSEHSANESYEGYNILFWVMSEASAFRSLTKAANGPRVYNTLKSSGASRFPGRWKGMVMSFPRDDEEIDFTYQLYKQGTEGKEDVETQSRIYSSKGATWEFKPARYYSGQTFEFEGEQIPIEYKEEYETDPDTAKRMYQCNPPKTAISIIPDEAIIKATHSRESLFELENTIEQGKIQCIVHGLEITTNFVDEYLITVDLGEVHSAAALALQHMDFHTGYTLDALGAWVPDAKAGLTVDLEDVRKVLIKIAKAIPRVKVYFDQWQSRLMSADLKREGIAVGEYHTYERDYKDFKRAMALGVAKILNHQTFITQLKALKQVEVNGKKIFVLDQKISKRKDFVDVAVGGFKTLMESVRTTDLPGHLIGSNLAAFGTVMWNE